MLRVLNKCDLLDPEAAESLAHRFDGFAVSAKDPSTFPPLVAEIGRRLGWPDLLEP